MTRTRPITCPSVSCDSQLQAHQLSLQMRMISFDCVKIWVLKSVLLMCLLAFSLSHTFGQHNCVFILFIQLYSQWKPISHWLGFLCQRLSLETKTYVVVIVCKLMLCISEEMLMEMAWAGVMSTSLWQTNKMLNFPRNSVCPFVVGIPFEREEKRGEGRRGEGWMDLGWQTGDLTLNWRSFWCSLW